jgi:hypothetical protein
MFLHALTSSTWGLSISLPDVISAHEHHHHEVSGRKKVDQKLKTTAKELVDLVSTAYLKSNEADTHDYGE